MTEDEKYMREAIRQAKKAEALEEVPIGCVIVREGKVIARGYNRRNTDKNTLSHAELNAIRKASKAVGDWRLENCTLYVTLEPCQMCSGAIVQSRMKRVVIGSRNPKAGCAGSVLNLLQVKQFNHQTEITWDVLEEECSQLLSGFFRKLREKQKQADSGKTLLRRLRDQLPGYEIKEGSEKLADDIHELMLGNTYYTERVLGKEPTRDSCIEDTVCTPPGITREKKTYAVFYKKGICVAILDFISDYPKEKTGFIGLYMLNGTLHGKGIGKKLFRHLAAAAKETGMERLRLGCYEANEIGLRFWKSRGFSVKEERDRTEGRLFLLEKEL